MISCINQGVNYTGINGTKNYCRPHLVNSSSEINLLANLMQNRLGLHYKILLINFYPRGDGIIENQVYCLC